MDICLINNTYRPYQRGGAERIVEIMADELNRRGHTVKIIALYPRGKRDMTGEIPAARYLASFFYDLSRWPYWLRLFWHIFDIFSLRRYGQIKRILSERQYDLVITNNLTGLGFLTPRAIRSGCKKHVHILHDIHLLHPSGLLYYGRENILDSCAAKTYQRIMARCFASVDTVVAPSGWLLKTHTEREIFKNARQLRLPNPVVLPKLDKMPAAECPHDRFCYLYVGLLEKHKGVEILIRAFNKLNGTNQNCSLTIIGRGSQREELTRIAANNKNIIFSGYRAQADVVTAMESADCLVVPSICYENSPSVIYEAFSAGLPVIASRIGGMTELVNNDALTFEPGDADSLRQTMRKVRENQAGLAGEIERNKNRARQWGPADYLDAILSIYP